MVVNHACHDEICRPIEDSGNLLNLRVAQALHKRINQRNAAAHAGFKKVIDIVFPGQL
jgi:hypothetical protein